MHILVATDGSDPAHRAVELGARLAKQLKGLLKIIHVANSDDFTLNYQTDDYARWQDRTDSDRMNAISEEKLKIARQWTENLGLSNVQFERQTGDAATSIIDAARRDNVDIIVLGKRGRGRLSGLLLGSVSQKVVSLAPCAVIVVP